MEELNYNAAPILIHVSNGDLYRYDGGEKYTNIRTGVSGEVTDEKAKQVFKIHVPLTVMIGKNKNIQKLINGLNLKIYK